MNLMNAYKDKILLINVKNDDEKKNRCVTIKKFAYFRILWPI